jgi:hypothetical protein
MNCPSCIHEACCNKRTHEMRNGVLSLQYVLEEFRRGNYDDSLLERMGEQITRIDKAVAGCRGKSCE